MINRASVSIIFGRFRQVIEGSRVGALTYWNRSVQKRAEAA